MGIYIVYTLYSSGVTYRDGLTLFGLKAAITTEYPTSPSKLMSSKLGIPHSRSRYTLSSTPYEELRLEYIQSQRNKIRTKYL